MSKKSKTRALELARRAASAIAPVVPKKPAVQQTFSAQSYRTFIDAWNPGAISTAERMADAGSFRMAASLCEAMLGDDRIRGTLIESRVKGLLGLTVTFELGQGRQKNRAAKAIEAEEDFYSAFPEAVLSEMYAWGVIFGLGIVHQTWVRARSGRLIQVCENIHASALRQDRLTKKWYLAQSDGSEIEVNPNDGTWIFYAPYGLERFWARGAWRSLSRYWLSKLYAISDWSRYGERHGQGLFAASADKDALSNEEDRRQLAADLNQLGREKAIALPPGFKLELVEATANTWATFQAQIGQADTAIAICVLGQNLSTEVKGGSFAAANVHKEVKQQILAGDSETLSTCLHDSSLIYWASFNFGSADAAPWPVWDTAAPEDTASLVTSWNQAGQALLSWKTLGADIDVEAAAAKVGLPLKSRSNSTNNAN